MNDLNRFLLVLGLLLSPFSYADCSVPSRLKVDSVVNDVASYAMGMKSVSKFLLKEKGFQSYDEYSYSSDSYSDAVLQIKNNIRTIGSPYMKALKYRLGEKEVLIEKAFQRLLERCTKDEISSIMKRDIWSSLSGNNREVEMALLQLNLNAISDSVKNLSSG